MLRWVGATLLGLGLVLGAWAVDRLPGMRRDTWEGDSVTLRPGAEVRLDYRLGMKGGRGVELVIHPREGVALPRPVQEPDVAWTRASGSRTLSSGAGPLRATSMAGHPERFLVEDFATEGDEEGVVLVKVHEVPEAFVGTRAALELVGPAYPDFAIADAAVLTIPLAVGALFALLTGLLLLFLPRDALAELATRSPGDPRAQRGARSREESSSARASGATS